VGRQQWVALASHPPFAQALKSAAPPPPPPPEALHAASIATAPGEGVGYAILLIPLGATVLIWVWIGNMNLLQDPATALTMVGFSTILVTAVLIAIEASQLGMGKAPVENGKKGSGPVLFVGTLVAWLIMSLVPEQACWYGKKSLAIRGSSLPSSSVVLGSAWAQ
jgi:hypothetical protein